MVLTHIEFWLLPWCLINLLLCFMTEATVIPIMFHPLHWLWLSWMIGMPNSHGLWLKYTFLSMSGVLVPSKSYSSNECGSYFWFKFPDSVEWYILSLNRLSHVSTTCLSYGNPGYYYDPLQFLVYHLSLRHQPDSFPTYLVPYFHVCCPILILKYNHLLVRSLLKWLCHLHLLTHVHHHPIRQDTCCQVSQSSLLSATVIKDIENYPFHITILLKWPGTHSWWSFMLLWLNATSHIY